MKLTLFYSMTSVTIFLSACVSTRQMTVLRPVGPAPFEQARNSPEGTLIVYSALDQGSTGDPDAYPHHSGYRIYFEDGNQLKYVNNQVATFSEEPAIVSLAPGRYKVVATAARVGTVRVPVVVEAGKTTALHLDGSEFPKEGTPPPPILCISPMALPLVGQRALIIDDGTPPSNSEL